MTDREIRKALAEQEKSKTVHGHNAGVLLRRVFNVDAAERKARRERMLAAWREREGI